MRRSYSPLVLALVLSIYPSAQMFAVTAPPEVPLTEESAIEIAEKNQNCSYHWEAGGNSVELSCEGGTGQSRKKYSAASALSALALIRKNQKSVTLTNGGMRLELGYGELSLSGSSPEKNTIYDIRSDIESGEKERSLDCPASRSPNYTPLSWVGPVVSFEESRSVEGACGREEWTRDYHAVQVPSLKPARLTDYVDERALVAAMLKDPFIVSLAEQCRHDIPEFCCEEREDCPGRVKQFDHALHSARTVAKLSQAFEEADCNVFELRRARLSGFAFLKYDPKRSRVAVRLSLRNYGVPGHMSELGLWVKPLPAFRAELEKTVMSHQGFFMGRFK